MTPQTINTTIGSVVDYNCYIGYEISDPLKRNILECASNLDWQGHVSECKIVSCPPIVHNEHTNLSSSSRTFGSKVNVTCQYGAVTANNNTWTETECLETKQWSLNIGDVQCYPVTCLPSIQDNVTNGIVSFSTDTLYHGTIATLTCNQGYWISPHHHTQQVECLIPGVWERSFDPCTVVECSSYPLWKNIDILNSTNSTFYQSEVYYKCAEGYSFDEILHNGTNVTSTVCDEYGFWSPPFLECFWSIPEEVIPPAEAPSSASIGALAIVFCSVLCAGIIALDLITFGTFIKSKCATG